MANFGQRIKSAVENLTSGGFWMDHCPKEASLDEWIVAYSMGLNPIDFGDDRDLDWEEGIAVKWTRKGVANYYDMTDKLRDALRDAGFSLGPVTHGYDGDDKRTNVIVMIYGLE